MVPSKLTLSLYSTYNLDSKRKIPFLGRWTRLTGADCAFRLQGHRNFKRFGGTSLGVINMYSVGITYPSFLDWDRVYKRSFEKEVLVSSNPMKNE
jgi:hypothetical protein